jgi:catechol 2,3-dioxygenase-like lactoylglutathione lyase family enzyme
MLRFHLATIVVDDYDDAIAFFVGTLDFCLTEDTDLGGGKRWVVVRPDPSGTGILLAKADGDRQAAAVGAQAGGRVSFFLYTDDVERDVAAWTARGVRFIETIRSEEYGKVTVFLDLYGNPWDLIEPPTGMGS